MQIHPKWGSLWQWGYREHPRPDSWWDNEGMKRGNWSEWVSRITLLPSAIHRSSWWSDPLWFRGGIPSRRDPREWQGLEVVSDRNNSRCFHNLQNDPPRNFGRNSRGWGSSSSGVSDLSSGEGSEVESMDGLSSCSDSITGTSSWRTSGSAEGGSCT